MNEPTLFKNGKWIDYGKFHPGVKILLRKWRGLGHVIVVRMKPRSLNSANASTMASATQWLKIPPPKRCGVGHVTAV